jgi:hypothetical protein
VKADELFDTYNPNQTSWLIERELHLFNFAIALKHDSKSIDYIYVFTTKNESQKKAKFRVNRAVKYLTQNSPPSLRIEKSRIIVIYKEEADSSKIILQPTPKGQPPIKF